MGGSTQNKNWVHPGFAAYISANNINTELQHYSVNNVTNIGTTIPPQTAILDSGATSHYIAQNHAHLLHNTVKDTSVHVNLPDGTQLTSQVQGTLPILEQKAHVLQGLNKSLLLIG